MRLGTWCVLECLLESGAVGSKHNPPPVGFGRATLYPGYNQSAGRVQGGPCLWLEAPLHPKHRADHTMGEGSSSALCEDALGHSVAGRVL